MSHVIVVRAGNVNTTILSGSGAATMAAELNLSLSLTLPTDVESRSKMEILVRFYIRFSAGGGAPTPMIRLTV